MEAHPNDKPLVTIGIEEMGGVYEVARETVSEAEFLVSQTLLTLERAATLAELKAANDKAVGIHSFAKQQKDCFGLQQAAANLRIRAQYKAGGMLLQIERERGKRTDKEGGETEYQRVLREEGLGLSEAMSWQRIAQIPETVLIDFLDKSIKYEQEITVAAVLTLLPEPDGGGKAGSKQKGEVKNRQVLLIDSAEMTIEEQDDLIWAAIEHAYLIAKKEIMREEMKALGKYPGYWLAMICSDYLASNPLEERNV